jgi:hypothetical protein
MIVPGVESMTGLTNFLNAGSEPNPILCSQSRSGRLGKSVEIERK